MGKSAKIFSFIKTQHDTMIASAKLARYVSAITGAPISCDESIGADGPIDLLIIVGGVYAFAGGSILASLGEAITQAGEVIWISQDYTVIPPKDRGNAESPFRKAFRVRHEKTGKPSVSFWTTVRDLASPGVAKSGHLCGARSRYINWNALAYRDDLSPMAFADRSLADTMIYYGSFREDRETYFDQYFADPRVKTVFSSPSDKRERYPLIQRMARLPSLDMLGEFGMGLYIEDKKSHRSYHSPANRFYEMLGHGLPMVFEPNCAHMLSEAGYDISRDTATSSREIAEMMLDQQAIMERQREQWSGRARVDYQRMASDLLAAWEEVSAL